MLVNGPVLDRDRIAQLFPDGTLARNNGAVFLDTPDRRIPYTHQVSFGYERQLEDSSRLPPTTCTAGGATRSWRSISIRR